MNNDWWQDFLYCCYSAETQFLHVSSIFVYAVQISRATCKLPWQPLNLLSNKFSLFSPHINTLWKRMGVEDLTLLTLLCEVTLKRSWAEVKRSTSKILAVMGRAVINTRAPDSLKPFVLYTAEKGMQFPVDTFTSDQCLTWLVLWNLKMVLGVELALVGCLKG